MCGHDNSIPETPEEVALAKIAMERWKDYKNKFVPVENMAISNVMKEHDNPSEFGTGVANLATQEQFSNLEQQAAKGLTNRGAGPGSGEFMGAITGLNRDRIASSALGQTNAMGLARTQNQQNMQALINMGQGQASGALSGLADSANFAQQQAIMDARASAAARAAIGSAIGTGAGMYYQGARSDPTTSTPYGPVRYSETTSVPVAQQQWEQATGNYGG